MPKEFEISNRSVVLEAIAKRRARKERVVFTNGCFDILHVGHARYLAEARGLGDALVVGVNNDSSTRRLKGPERPICPEDERAELLLALKVIDFVCLFEEETPLELIKLVRPDVLVKGGDWPEDQIVGSSFVRSYGGEVHALAFYAGHSTTDIVTRIRSGS